MPDQICELFCGAGGMAAAIAGALPGATTPEAV